MFEKLKGNILFNALLKRPDIEKAYAMVPETDSWYDTISKVHKSLEEIKTYPHEVLEIKSHDDLTLKGIYYPCVSNSNNNVTVICVHGYTSHAEREWAFPGLFYKSLGFNVLIPYQRAHGISEGKYITFGAYEHIDLINWVNKINSINPNTKIIIHGLSMGGGIVLDFSDKKLNNVKCLICDAPSTSINSFFKNVANEVFKSKGDLVYKHAVRKFNITFRANILDYESINFVKNSKYPILLSAGSEEHMEDRLNEIKKANPNDTEIIILPGCNHGNGMYKQTKMYQDKIIEFINKYL